MGTGRNSINEQKSLYHIWHILKIFTKTEKGLSRTKNLFCNKLNFVSSKKLIFTYIIQIYSPKFIRLKIKQKLQV